MRRLARLMLLGLIVFAGVSSAPAVIIKGGDGTGNTTAPAGDPGWSNVGTVNGSSCVYLGNGWVLTAAHVGMGAVNLNGTNYSAASGSWTRLHNPSNPTQVVDLGLFELLTDPGLPSVAISSTAPTTNAQVLGIGYGKDRQASETWWNSSWQEQTAPKTFTGFYWASSNTKRWGTNNISGTTVYTDPNYGTTALLVTNFSNTGDSNEMQLALNDSGGGLFYNRSGSWELAGVNLLIDYYSGQPPTSAVYGNNSYFANLSVYRGEIMSIVPEPGSLALLFSGSVLAWLVWRRRGLRS